MANRKGVFIGAYVPNHLKESLRRRAAAEHRTLSQEITRILEEAVHGRGLPPGSLDRRNKESQPRRRFSDPMPRRRAQDEPYGSPVTIADSGMGIRIEIPDYRRVGQLCIRACLPRVRPYLKLIQKVVQSLNVVTDINTSTAVHAKDGFEEQTGSLRWLPGHGFRRNAR